MLLSQKENSANMSNFKDTSRDFFAGFFIDGDDSFKLHASFAIIND